MSTELRYAVDRATEELYPRYPTYTIGVSGIGHECARYLFYSLRWMSNDDIITPRMKRLLNRGNHEEILFEKLITKIGFQPIKAEGKQHKVEHCKGHVKGYADGIAATCGIDPLAYPKLSQLPSHVLLEYKTCGTGRGFADYSKTVILHKPIYYAQICVMGFSFNIPTCVFLVVNKNDDDIYAEVVELDFSHAKKLIDRAGSVIFTNNPPKKLAQSPSFSTCKSCKHNTICHHDGLPVKSCRSCVYSKAVEDRNWYCNKYNSVIPRDYQKEGCEVWEPILA